MGRLAKMLSMLVRENLSAGRLSRTPEDLLVMDVPHQVEAWHAQGANDGPIVPVYHFNALACSRLTPTNATVVDLACGSGRFAAYLARLRPDLQIVGLDLSEPMIQVGNQALREEGLADRVELRFGDMASFSRDAPAETSLISCVFAMHHLPSIDGVVQCLAEIKNISEKSACGFWIFDLVRPRHETTAYDYPDVFTPDAPAAFRADSTNSLVAAYSHSELRDVIDEVFVGAGVERARSLLFPLYQAFWKAGESRDEGNYVSSEARPVTVVPKFPSHDLRMQYRGLRAILPRVPQ